MAKRKRLTRKGSKKLFTAAGLKTHRKNVAPAPMRGGYRI